MAACPPLAQSRNDLRPPAGAKPGVPAWAQNDHVLKNWILEERRRRRTFLADQVLEHYEPLPVKVKRNPLFNSIRNLLWPLNEATGYRLFPGIYKMRGYLILFILPMWGVHYYVKYHVATIPERIRRQRLPIYPGEEAPTES